MSSTTIGPWAIAATGAVALATAMGIGRFAFTPLLPMMLHDGVLDLAGASWLASANYLGYLLGAVLCTLQPWIWRRIGNPSPPDPAAMVRGGLVATTLLTLAMALPWPAAWPSLRFAAGVASACVFVYISGWCLAQLARRGRAALGGMIYVGPGTGIVLSGLIASAIVAANGPAWLGWAVFGQLPDATTALGIACICGAGIAVALVERRLNRRLRLPMRGAPVPPAAARSPRPGPAPPSANCRGPRSR